MENIFPNAKKCYAPQTNLSKFQSGATGVCNIIEEQFHHDFKPFCILEDDVSKYREFPQNIEVPDDADILYIGTSSSGYNHKIKNDYRNVYTKSVKDYNNLCKIYNMLSTHGLIIVSKLGALILHKSMMIAKSKNIPYDIPITTYQPYYNIYCLKAPLVYQDAKYGGKEKATRHKLNMKHIDAKIPDEYLTRTFF
jgi:hypothetical protein